MRLPWPLPALAVWAGAWLVFAGLRAVLPPLPALLLACALGVAGSLLATTWWRRGLIALGFPLSAALTGAVALPAWAWLLPLALLLLVYPINAWRDAPLFPTPPGALRGLEAHAALADGAPVLDAGCGLGDGLKALRAAYPRAQLHGLEWSWPLALLCRLRCPWASVRQGNMWVADWGPYHLVYLFQRPESMSRAAVKSMAEMPPGAWLVSLNFPLPDTPPTLSASLPDGRAVYAYQCPIASMDAQEIAAHEAAGHTAALTPDGVMVRGQRLYPLPRRPGGRRRST